MSSQEIKELRKNLGLTQAQLSQLVGAHVMTVSSWERGERSPTPFQTALMREFRKATAVRAAILPTLFHSGAMSALYIMLQAAKRGAGATQA